MPKGFGRKPDRTKKCRCDNPRWNIWEIRETSRHELVITLECLNCHALWDTRSRSARRFADPSCPIEAGKPRTYDELFRRVDEDRKEMLRRLLENKEKESGRILNEMEVMRRELEFLKAVPLIPEK